MIGLREMEMKASNYNTALGRRLKADRAVLRPRSRTFRIVAIAAISVALMIGIYAW